MKKIIKHILLISLSLIILIGLSEINKVIGEGEPNPNVSGNCINETVGGPHVGPIPVGGGRTKKVSSDKNIEYWNYGGSPSDSSSENWKGKLDFTSLIYQGDDSFCTDSKIDSKLLTEIAVNDEGAMDFNTIQVPPSGILKDNFEVSYSNGQLIFTLPTGISIKGRNGHDIDIKLIFNSGINRPDGKVGNFWSLVPYGFMYFDQLVKLGTYNQTNPSREINVFDQISATPYLYQFQNGNLSVLTNIDAMKGERFFLSSNADFVIPNSTLTDDEGYESDVNGVITFSPKINHAWIAPNDMVCTGLFSPFVKSNPDHHYEDQEWLEFTKFIFPPGVSKKYRWNCQKSWVRENDGSIYRYSYFYKRQDKRYQITQEELPHQGLESNPTGDYEYARVQWKARLEEINYTGGDSVSYFYDEYDRLESIRDCLGRRIYFEYNDSNYPNKITRIYDFDQYEYEREVILTYYSPESGLKSGLLKELITPFPTNGVIGGTAIEWKFDYTCIEGDNTNYFKQALTNKKYLEDFWVWSPSEEMGSDQPYFHAVFDNDWDFPEEDEYRVSSLTCGSDVNDIYTAGGTYNYDYIYNSSTGTSTTICTLPIVPPAEIGQKNEYIFDTESNLVQETLGYNTQDEVTTQYFYYPDDAQEGDCYPFALLYKTILPRGNEIVNYYQYDQYLIDEIVYYDMDTYQIGNLLKKENRNEAGIGQEVMRTYEYTYEPYLNQIFTETDPNGNTTRYYYGFQEKAYSDLSFVGMLKSLWEIDDTDFVEGNNFSWGDLNESNQGGIGDEEHLFLVRVTEPVVTKGLAAEGGDQIVKRTYKYNESAQLIEEIDEEERVTQYEYYSDLSDPDGDGEHIIAGGDIVTNGGGYIKKEIRAPSTALEAITEYTYDSMGNITSEIDPCGNRTVKWVNERGQVWKEVKGEVNASGYPLNGNSALIKTVTYYDIEGNAVKVLNKNDNPITNSHASLEYSGFVTSNFEYDILGQLRKSSRENVYIDHGQSGEPVLYEVLSENFIYDSMGNLTYYISPGGSVVRAEYDNVWNKISEKRKFINPVTVPWDGESLPSEDDDDNILTFGYDDNGNLETVTDSEGDTYTIEYDDMDRRIKMIRPNESTLENELDDVGNIIYITESGEFLPGDDIKELKKQELFYDERNRVYKEKTYYYKIDDNGTYTDITTGANQGYSQVEYKLNRLGETLLTKNDEGIVAETSYDDLGRVEWDKSPELDGFTHQNITNYTYDLMGNILEETRHEYGFNSNNTEVDIPYTTTNNYDGLYRLVQTTKDNEGGNDQIWLYSYDQLGNKIDEMNPKEVKTKYCYDTFGRMTTQIFGYNSTFTQGLITGVNNSDQLIIKKMGYDKNGNIIFEKDDLGNTTKYYYDALNRKEKVEYSDGTYEELSYRTDDLIVDFEAYDNVGPNLLYTIHSNYVDKQKTSDEITIEEGVDLFGNTDIDYLYDGLERIVEISTVAVDENDNSFSTTVERRYDSMDNILEETQGITGTGINEEETIYLEYNGLKSRSKIDTTLSSYSVTYSFDELQRISTIDGSSSLGIKQVSRIYQGPGGRITSINCLNSTETKIDTDGYDGLGRLTDLIHQNSSKNNGRSLICDFAYEYDIGNCRTFEWKGHYTDKDNGYHYDLANRLIQYEQGHYNSNTHSIDEPYVSSRTFGLDGVGNFRTHNGNNNSVNSLNAYDSFDGTFLDYDERGNTTDIGSMDLSYDVWGRVVGATGGSQTPVTYIYDGFGRRLLKIVDEDKTFYLMEGDRVLQEYGDTTTKSFMWGAGIDELVGLKIGSNSYHAHLDAIGSVVALTNSSANLVERYDYDPYGVCTATGTDVGNPYRFTGRRWDSEIESYYLRARHYSPEMGRFLSRDPIGVWGDAGNIGNSYAYAGNNPVLYVDPLGERFFFAGGAGHDQGNTGYIEKIEDAFTKAGIENVVDVNSHGCQLADASFAAGIDSRVPSDQQYEENIVSMICPKPIVSKIPTNWRITSTVDQVKSNLEEKPLGKDEQLNIGGYSSGSVSAAQGALILADEGQVVDNLVLIGSTIKEDSKLGKRLKENKNIKNIIRIDIPGDNVTDVGLKEMFRFYNEGDNHPHFKYAFNKDADKNQEELAETLMNEGVE